MKGEIEEIRKLLTENNEDKINEIKEIFTKIISKKLIVHRIDKYIGDYPTFIEPVYLGDNVKIGDDVLIGPNVYLGNNVELSDYVEISNTLVLDNVKIAENEKLENAIVDEKKSINL